jgi:hypothetical protein
MLSRVSGMLYMFRTRHRLASSLGPSQLHMVGAISFGDKQYAIAPALHLIRRDPPGLVFSRQLGRPC